MRRAGWLARALRRALRLYRLGQPSVMLEGVSDQYVAIDFAGGLAVPAVTPAWLETITPLTMVRVPEFGGTALGRTYPRPMT